MGRALQHTPCQRDGQPRIEAWHRRIAVHEIVLLHYAERPTKNGGLTQRHPHPTLAETRMIERQRRAEGPRSV